MMCSGVSPSRLSKRCVLLRLDMVETTRQDGRRAALERRLLRCAVLIPRAQPGDDKISFGAKVRRQFPRHTQSRGLSVARTDNGDSRFFKEREFALHGYDRRRIDLFQKSWEIRFARRQNPGAAFFRRLHLRFGVRLGMRL